MERVQGGSDGGSWLYMLMVMVMVMVIRECHEGQHHD
jgi:hypothetical protein